MSRSSLDFRRKASQRCERFSCFIDGFIALRLGHTGWGGIRTSVLLNEVMKKYPRRSELCLAPGLCQDLETQMLPVLNSFHKRLKLARWKSRKHALPEGTTISQLQVICYLGRMGRSQKFIFLCEMLFVNHIHAHTTWAKKKIFFKDSVCKSWSPFVCLWALSL